MAKRARFKVTGLRETQRALRALPDEIETPAVVEALTESAEPMRALAADLAPRRRAEDSLADNIITTDKLTDSGGAGARAFQRDEAGVYVGPDTERPNSAPHGHLVEFGTGPRYQESGKYTGQMPAQPFMRPAFDAMKETTTRLFGPKLGRIVERAAAKVKAT